MAAAIFALLVGSLRAEGSGLRMLPVPTRVLEVGEIIGEKDITERQYQTTARSLIGIALDSSSVIGREVRRRIHPGRPIPLSATSVPRIVHRGDRVNMTYRHEQILISVQVIALADGAVGDVITARNIESGAMISAEVLGNGGLVAIER